MFVIWDPRGGQTPYSPGALRDRRVEPVAGPTPVGERDRATGHPGGGGASGPQRAYREAAAPRREREPAVTARQIMSSPVRTLRPETSIREAWGLITEHRFRHIPVVSRDERLAGILSDRDVLRAMGRADRSTLLSVAGIMTTEVLSARPEAVIRDLAGVMFHERIGAVPIVEASGAVVGILTRTDILRALYTRGPLALWA